MNKIINHLINSTPVDESDDFKITRPLSVATSLIEFFHSMEFELTDKKGLIGSIIRLLNMQIEVIGQSDTPMHIKLILDRQINPINQRYDEIKEEIKNMKALLKKEPPVEG